MKRKRFTIFVAVLLCVMICPQFGMFIAVKAAPANFSVDLLLDYGNGTRTWSTCILSKPGHDTAFNATQIAADTLNYTVSGSGIFVDAINGVWNNWTSGYWWALFFWNFTSGNWTSSPVGADQLVLSEDDMIAWFYDLHPWPPLPPANPPVTQVEIMLDYGNGTVTSEMVFLTGASNAFKATQDTADTLNYTMYGDDPFVDAINGVWNNWTSGYWWALFFWNFTSGNWTSSPVGMRTLELSDGDIIAWFYDLHPWPPLPPANPPVTQVDVILDYGNGTVTQVIVILTGASNAFKATQIAADTMSYTMYSFGILVDSINGVWGNATHWWSLWFWNFTSGSWEFSMVGADGLVLSNGDVVAWLYTDSWTPDPPVNPPRARISDLNGDGTVNILDVIILAGSFGSELGDQNWNPYADLNDDYIINILDAIILASHFGETV